jgi:endonuclease/exonuclease/phosphatase (EEP) superfamily protein YafD
MSTPSASPSPSPSPSPAPAPGTTPDPPERMTFGRRNRRRIPAFITGVIGALCFLGLPLIAHHIDGSADEFSSHHVPILPAIGWVIVAALGAVVVTHRLQIIFSVDEGSAIAVLYDVLPLLLFVAPVIGLWSLLSGHLLLAGAAGVLTTYQLYLIVPRLRSDDIPTWVHGAPRLRLVVANVFVDNPTPHAAAVQLVRTHADVIVIAEATPAFMAQFDRAGGARSHPHRVFDPADTSDYAVTVASRRPLADGSEVRMLGDLKLAIAKLQIDGAEVTVAALNPMATFDPGGHETWKRQMAALREFVPTVCGPLVVAGDLNTTRFRPEFEDLLDSGLQDAIDSLGEAWRPSFSLKSVWPLGAIGRIARLDHALVNDQVHALRVRNLRARGSDHLPFVISLALRTGGP